MKYLNSEILNRSGNSISENLRTEHDSYNCKRVKFRSIIRIKVPDSCEFKSGFKQLWKMIVFPRCFILVPLLMFSVLYRCKERPLEISKSFYYWKTTFDLGNEDRIFLNSIGIKRMYVRFFDVDWVESEHDVFPIGRIEFITKPDSSLRIIPVIYITNKSFTQIGKNEIDKLSGRIVDEIFHIADHVSVKVSEIQLDCDWTNSTRELYFLLISNINKRIKKQKIRISATIRLHQIKYYKTTGIPDVDRGILMFYNMGQINAVSGRNSIFNEEDLAGYIRSIKKYPLPLDIAIPCFSWGIHIRNDSVIELLNNWDNESVSDTLLFDKTENGQYSVRKSLFYKGVYLKGNDKIKIEAVDLNLCCRASKLASESTERISRSIIIFDYKKLYNLENEKEELDKIFNCFY